METNTIRSNSHIDKEFEEFIKENRNILYKRTSDEIGKRQDEGGKQEKHVNDGKFTKVLIINQASCRIRNV
jgi:hypothetical protein